MEDYVTLEELLEAKDARYIKQKKLIEAYKETLIVFTLNIPGKEKNNDKIKQIFDIGYKTLKECLSNKENILYAAQYDLKTGNEGYLVIKENSEIVKKLAIDLEERHPVGRLFDIDVFTNSGEVISRSTWSFEKRRCFVCEKAAVECSRSKRHTEEEIQQVLKGLFDKIHIIT